MMEENKKNEDYDSCIKECYKNIDYLKEIKKRREQEYEQEYLELSKYRERFAENDEKSFERLSEKMHFVIKKHGELDCDINEAVAFFQSKIDTLEMEKSKEMGLDKEEKNAGYN